MEENIMFEKIAIGIKTFLRDEQLFNTIRAIQKYYSKAQLIIADCGDATEEKDGIYADLERQGHKTIQLPFDAGFGAMSNAIADALTRPYLLVGSDDFDFYDSKAKLGVERLQHVLENCPNIDIASGRVNNRPYEFLLEDLGDKIVEKPINRSLDTMESYYDCPAGYAADLTVNYSLIRNRVFDQVRWDSDVKIGGGEHGAFFMDCKRAGFKTIYVPNVNINEQQIRNSPRYNEFRNRARGLERPCFVKRGIREYVLGDGRIDYKENQ
jgi:hypothetical protein